MTDKVQKIKEWISKEQDGLMGAQGNFEYPSNEGAFHILSRLDHYIDSLQEEPVSEDLEEAIGQSFICHENRGDDFRSDKQIETAYRYGFETGAKWQKEQDQSTIELAEDHAMLAGMEKMKEEVMANTADAMIGLPYENKDGGYTHLIDVSRPLPVGSNKIAIIFKED